MKLQESIKRLVTTVLVLLLLAITAPLGARCADCTVKFINKTGERLGLVTLNKPFSRSDKDHVSFIWLDPEREVNIVPKGRLAGWYIKGEPTGFTVIGKNDAIITFVYNNDRIRTLHGELRVQPLTNSHRSVETVITKNPNQGEQDCIDCAHNCYRDAGTVRHCTCLDWCWDHTRDLIWRLDSYETKKLLVTKGTDLGIFLPEHALDDTSLLCAHGYCHDIDDADDDQDETIVRITRIHY